MHISLRCSYRLVTRGEAGLACDGDGLALGAADLTRVRLDADGARRCEARSTDEIGQILMMAYGPQPDGVVLRLHKGLTRAAAIEAGDLGRAGIEAVKLGFPDLTREAMTKLAEIDDVEKRNTGWEAEPRLSAGQAGGGQWTTGDGGAPQPNARPAAVGARRERSAPPSPSLNAVDETNPDVATPGNWGGFHPTDDGLLIHVGTAAVMAHEYDLAGDVPVLNDAARLGRAGLLGLAAALLDHWHADVAQNQISMPSRALDSILTGRPM